MPSSQSVEFIFHNLLIIKGYVSESVANRFRILFYQECYKQRQLDFGGFKISNFPKADFKLAHKKFNRCVKYTEELEDNCRKNK